MRATAYGRWASRILLGLLSAHVALAAPPHESPLSTADTELRPAWLERVIHPSGRGNIESQACSASYAEPLRNFFYAQFKDFAEAKKAHNESITSLDLAKFAHMLFTANYQSRGVPTLLSTGSGSDRGGFLRSRQDFSDGQNFVADTFQRYSERLASFDYQEDSSFGLFKLSRAHLKRMIPLVETLRKSGKNPNELIEACGAATLYHANQLDTLRDEFAKNDEQSLMKCDLASSPSCLPRWVAACPKLNLEIFAQRDLPIRYFAKEVRAKKDQFENQLVSAPCASVFLGIAESIQGKNTVRVVKPQVAVTPRAAPVTKANVVTAKSSSAPRGTESHSAPTDSTVLQARAVHRAASVPSTSAVDEKSKLGSLHLSKKEVAPVVYEMVKNGERPPLDTRMSAMKQGMTKTEKASLKEFLSTPSEVDRSHQSTAEFADALIANYEYVHKEAKQIYGSDKDTWDTRIGSCYKYIKHSLARSGITPYFSDTSAVNAKETLKKYGFRNMLDKNKKLKPDDAAVPKGAVIIYANGDSNGKILRSYSYYLKDKKGNYILDKKGNKILRRVEYHGDIAFKTDRGMGANYYNSKSFGEPYWIVVGIMVKD